MIVFRFLFHNLMPLPNLGFNAFKDSFPTLKQTNCPDLYPLIRPPKMLLTVVRDNPYTGIHSLPYYVSHLQYCPLSPASEGET